ncbi:MAG: hypothetical protein R2873_02945 [Caldilineaceae bacterium]
MTAQTTDAGGSLPNWLRASTSSLLTTRWASTSPATASPQSP